MNDCTELCSGNIVARRLSCSICHRVDFEKMALEVLTSLYQNACLRVLSLAGSFVTKNAIKLNIKVSALLCHPCPRFWGMLRSNVTYSIIAARSFYRAMHFSAYARSWDRMSSVRPSVTLVDCDHIGWKSWKLITRTTSATPSLFVAKRRST